jgi:hypothetical protein
MWRVLTTVCALAVMYFARDSGESVEAFHVLVTSYLHHPTGDSFNDAELVCGWHDGCDEIHYPGEALRALDWKYASGTSTVTRVAIRSYHNGSGSSPTKVARVLITTQAFQNCVGLRYEIREHTLNRLVGSVRQYHVYSNGLSSGSLYATPGGYEVTHNIGHMFTSRPPDRCIWNGPHVHQWYQNNEGLSPIQNFADFPQEPTLSGPCYPSCDRFQFWESSVNYLH